MRQVLARGVGEQSSLGGQRRRAPDGRVRPRDVAALRARSRGTSRRAQARLRPRLDSRPRSSAAALRVKVSVSTYGAEAVPSFTRQAIRRVRTRVLPDPAAASTQSFFASVVIASRCSASHPARSRPARSPGCCPRACPARRHTQTVPAGCRAGAAGEGYQLRGSAAAPEGRVSFFEMLTSFAGARLFGESYGAGTPWVLALHGWRRDHQDFDAVLGPPGHRRGRAGPARLRQRACARGCVGNAGLRAKRSRRCSTRWRPGSSFSGTRSEVESPCTWRQSGQTGSPASC